MSKLTYAPTLLREFTRFAVEHKMYWIVPLVLMLGFAGLVVVASQSAAPLIYTLF